MSKVILDLKDLRVTGHPDTEFEWHPMTRRAISARPYVNTAAGCPDLVWSTWDVIELDGRGGMTLAGFIKAFEAQVGLEAGMVRRCRLALSKPTLKAPASKRLILNYDQLVSNPGSKTT